MWEVFNNREIAFMAWILIISPFLLSIRALREPLAGILRVIFSGGVVLGVLILALYMGAVVYLLECFDLWTLILLKDTLFWFFSAGLLTVYRCVLAKDGNIPIRELMYDNLRLVLILEFLLNTYTFALWAELIIVPVATSVAMLQAFAEASKGNRNVTKFLGGVLSVVGIAMIGHTLYSAVQDYQALVTLETLHSFVLPILLSTAIIPAAYLMAVYTKYKNLFIGFKFGYDKSRGFVTYCKWMVFFHCGLSTKKISSLKPFHLMHLQSKEDLRNIFQELDGGDTTITPLEQ